MWHIAGIGALNSRQRIEILSPLIRDIAGINEIAFKQFVEVVQIAPG